MSNIFRRAIETYVLSRPKIMAAYLENMTDHLRQQHPDVPVEKINAFVQGVVRTRLKRPKVFVHTHPRYGVTEQKEVDLLQYATGLQTEIITPAGVIYMPPSRKKSILAQMLEASVAARNKFKHMQLQAAAVGDSVKEIIYKLLQASTKIFNNSIPGGMGARFSFLYDLPGYNAITSGSRQSVKTGYAHTERMVASNLYLTSVDDVINYVVLHTRVCPHDQVKHVMQKYGIAYPSIDEVANFFFECLKFYTDIEAIRNRIVSYISTLTDVERAYVFYAYGYRNLLITNEKIMRAYFEEFFRRDVPADPAANPEDIFKVEDDLLAMATSLNFDTINREPKMDVAVKENPDGVRKLLAICSHMQACLDKWKDLWETFFIVDVSFSRLWEHPDIVRRCVLVSDTDSVIFSTDIVTNWYSPKERFCQDAYDINAFTVFLLSQSLEHVLARMSAGFGMEGKDKARIRMKNEFYYPVFIRSPAAKHYAGAIYIQEGKILPKPKMDIKGVIYRGSDLPAETSDAFVEFVKWVLDEIMKHSTISVADILGRIAAHERTIYKSLMSGQRTFLPTASVRNADEYANAAISEHFYYLFWEAVFAPSFGEFVIPNKGYTVPILNDGKALKDPAWRDELKAFDPALLERFEAFEAKHPHKKLTHITIPPSLTEVPEIFRKILDVRKIVHMNDRPFFLFTRSLGCGLDDKDGRYIASDFIELTADSVNVEL